MSARHLWFAIGTLVVTGSVLTAAASSLDHGTLSSAETRICIEADEHFPRLTTLRGRGSSADSGADWVNRAVESLPAQVEMHGTGQSLQWQYDRAASHWGGREILLVYVAEHPRLRLSWRWRARAEHGPLEHSTAIQNLDSEEIWLPLIPSFSFDWRVSTQTPLQRFWVEKGADTPSAEGTHEDAVLEGTPWRGTSSTYARPIPNQPREMIPYLLVHDTRAEQRGWYLGIEFSGRTQITLQRSGDSLRGEAGLNPQPAPYRTRLLPQETFNTPEIFLGAVRGGADGAGNILRRWVRTVLNNPQTLRDPRYPLMVNNSWGSGMAADETLARRMIGQSRDLGLEMFHLDAGWFCGVGDWQADSAKFPHGIGAVADYAHQLNLKFGLWIDWTQAGVSTAMDAPNVSDPNTRAWLIADPPVGWQHREAFKGITMDLGIGAVQRWAAATLERVVTDNRLDMLEHDGYLVAQGSTRAAHGDPLTADLKPRIYEDSGYLWAEGRDDTDVSYHATRAYYALYEQLRQRHPALLLEVCNDGGRMVDFGSAAHGDYFSITDTYDPLSNRRAFFDASFALPPAMLESYVGTWPVLQLDNLRYMLRSGMMGWFSLMLDSNLWTPEQRAVARTEFALYKSALRPLIREADLYHVSARPDGVRWDGIEYYSDRQQRGVLFVFRGSDPRQPAHRFRLRGLDPQRRYGLRFQDRGAGADVVASGQALMRDGLEVKLIAPLSSELVFLALIP